MNILVCRLSIYRCSWPVTFLSSSSLIIIEHECLSMRLSRCPQVSSQVTSIREKQRESRFVSADLGFSEETTDRSTMERKIISCASRKNSSLARYDLSERESDLSRWKERVTLSVVMISRSRSALRIFVRCSTLLSWQWASIDLIGRSPFPTANRSR